MQSSIDKVSAVGPSASCRSGDSFKRWNGRVHYYSGLYFLFFIWLFAFTGLLLNHSQWEFASFWESRRQSSFDRDIVAPPEGAILVQARNIMQQLGIRGEIEWTASGNDANRFDFRVSRPGHIFEVKTDLANRKASIQRIDLNGWGVMRILHTFTGVRMDDPRNPRDWLLTSVWALSMDAVAVGLILMVLTSLYMWYDLKQKRLPGLLALLLGSLTCALFCIGLRWL